MLCQCCYWTCCYYTSICLCWCITRTKCISPQALQTQQATLCRDAAAKVGASDSPPPVVADALHPKNATPTAPCQPAGRPASPGQLQGRIRWPHTGLWRIGGTHTGLGRSGDARQGSFPSKGMLPNLVPGRMRHLWPRATQGPSAAAAHDGEAGEQSGEGADLPCGPAWQQNVARPRRADSHSSGTQEVRPGEARIERSPSPAAPHAQGSPQPERSPSSGGRRPSSGRAVSHGRNASSQTSSHGASGSQRSRGGSGRRGSGSQAVSHSQHVPSLAASHGHSGPQSSHRRRRCGRGRRGLGAILRKQQRFIGGWRHSRHPWGSRSRGRSSSAIIAAAPASADQGARPLTLLLVLQAAVLACSMTPTVGPIEQTREPQEMRRLHLEIILEKDVPHAASTWGHTAGVQAV